MVHVGNDIDLPMETTVLGKIMWYLGTVWDYFKSVLPWLVLIPRHQSNVQTDFFTIHSTLVLTCNPNPATLKINKNCINS